MADGWRALYKNTSGSYNTASGSGVAVRIDSTGKLGTVLSSARYNEAIKPMDKASEAILALEPVTFRYKRNPTPIRSRSSA